MRREGWKFQGGKVGKEGGKGEKKSNTNLAMLLMFKKKYLGSPG